MQLFCLVEEKAQKKIKHTKGKKTHIMEILANLTLDDYLDYVTVHNNGAVFVKLTASWCNPCRQIAPFVDDKVDWIRRIDRKKNVKMISLDIDANPIIFSTLKRLRIVKGVPAFFVYLKKHNLSAENKITKREAMYPDDLVIGANIDALDLLFTHKILPIISIV